MKKMYHKRSQAGHVGKSPVQSPAQDGVDTEFRSGAAIKEDTYLWV